MRAVWITRGPGLSLRATVHRDTAGLGGDLTGGTGRQGSALNLRHLLYVVLLLLLVVLCPLIPKHGGVAHGLCGQEVTGGLGVHHQGPGIAARRAGQEQRVRGPVSGTVRGERGVGVFEEEELLVRAAGART